MNERIRLLAEQAKLRPALLLKHWGAIDALTNSEQEELSQLEQFAELIVAESINLLKREWYALNNAPAGETETPRDIGLRVGARDQTGHLINVIERHFGVEQ